MSEEPKSFKKYRAYPARYQERAVDKGIDVCRGLYNGVIYKHRVALKAYAAVYNTGILDEDAKFPQENEIKKELTAIRATNKRVASVYREIEDSTIRRAFNAIKARKKGGKVRFKSASQFKTLKFGHADRGNRVRITPNGHVSVYISEEIGYLRLRNNRQIPKNFTEISITVKNNKYYVIFTVSREDECLPDTGKSIGLDAGITNLLTSNEGFLEENLYHLNKNKKILEKKAKKVAAAQRRLDKATAKNETNKVLNKDDKTRIRRAKALSSITENLYNSKLDFYHKVTRSIVNGYDFMAIEDLSLKKMKEEGNTAQRAGLHDAAIGKLYQLLSYKAESAGRTVVKINPAYTSQTCSECGFCDVQNRLLDKFHCKSCSFKENADINAARNILKKGLEEAGRQ